MGNCEVIKEVGVLTKVAFEDRKGFEKSIGRVEVRAGTPHGERCMGKGPGGTVWAIQGQTHVHLGWNLTGVTSSLEIEFGDEQKGQITDTLKLDSPGKPAEDF